MKNGWSQMLNVFFISALLMGNTSVDYTKEVLSKDLQDLQEKLCETEKTLEIYKEHYVPKTYKNKFLTKLGVNMDINECLLEGLKNYNGPEVEILITSGNDSHHSPYSDHYKNLAVDISARSDKRFIEWLISDKAKWWLETYNFDFYLENMYEYKYHPKFMQNGHATGPHIHLWMKEN